MCVFSPHMYNEIHHGFIEAGCEVSDLFISDEFTERTDLLRIRLIAAIDGFKPDFVYSYGWWKDIIDINEYFNVIKQKGVFHIWWSADDPSCFNMVSLPVARRSDLVFTPAEELLPLYANYGIKAYLQPNACSPHHSKSTPKAEYKHDAVLIANNYNMRFVDEETKRNTFYEFRLKGIHHILMPLINNQMDVMVWGRWWSDWDRACTLPEKHYGGLLPAEEASHVYASAKIALGLQQIATSKTFVSVRTFEALGCGAFHITQYSPGVACYFKKGVHLEWSESPQETLELVNYYLLHDKERERIGLAGQREVDEKHRLVHRARSVLDVIRKYI